MNKKCRALLDLSWERPESILYIFNTLVYVTSFANISIWNLIFGKHILSCWLYQYLRSRWYGSHDVLRKCIELFFVHTNVQAGLPQCFVFYNFVREGGKGRFLLPENTIFTIFKISLLKFLVFRVFLSFTICSNNANFKVVQTRTLMKCNVFPICREKFFSTNP